MITHEQITASMALTTERSGEMVAVATKLPGIVTYARDADRTFTVLHNFDHIIRLKPESVSG
jgi:hypothetical protein